MIDLLLNTLLVWNLRCKFLLNIGWHRRVHSSLSFEFLFECSLIYKSSIRQPCTAWSNLDLLAMLDFIILMKLLFPIFTICLWLNHFSLYLIQLVVFNRFFMNIQVFSWIHIFKILHLEQSPLFFFNMSFFQLFFCK